MTLPATTPERSSGPSAAVKARRRTGSAVLRRLPLWFGISVAAASVLWVLFFATGTSAGSAVSNPGRFVVTLLDGITFAGLLFVAAAGFTLVFGLMRTVNMAHGSLLLLSAFIAIRVQQSMVGKTRNIDAADVSLLSWIVPTLAGASAAAVAGLLIHQAFLRWNQGQELRQALITLAITVVLADQMLREFGGLAQRMVWPGDVTHFYTILGQRFAATRLIMLGVAVLVGLLLWWWLTRTRIGLVIRAGVDDQQMVRALGINLTLVFAVVFFVGAFLAGLGGAMVGSFGGAVTGTDGQWLLNALVVVIIGGLGSLRGAAAGSLLYGLVLALAPAYLPAAYTFYSIIVTFALLALVLAVRPNGLFGRPG